MKKIKPIIQHDLKDCGACCMQWIIIYYDGYIPLEKLKEDTLTDLTGTSAYHLVEAFKKWGFDAIGVLETDLKSPQLNYPAIAHLRLENGLEHFVVIKEVINNTIYIMDPGIGNCKYDINDFNKLFTGHLIICYPREKIVKLDASITIKKLFLNIVNKEKNLIIKIIITSLLFNFLVITNSYYLKIGSNLIDYDKTIIKYIILVFGFLTLIKIFFLYIREYYINHLSNLVDVYIYPEFIRHLFFLPLKSIRNRTVGEITTRISELNSIKSLFSDIFITGFLDSFMLVISMVILYIINQKLFLLLFMFIIIYFIYGYFISKIIYRKVLENINYQTDFNSIITESITMFETIKNLNIINIILKKIESYLAKYLLSNYEFVKIFNTSNLGKNFLIEMSFYLINSYGLLLVYNNKLSIVDLFTFNIIISYTLEPVKNIINLLPKYNYVKATFSKISEFINLEEEKLLTPIKNIDGDIIFNKVSYSYNNYDYILNNCNFIIKKGTHVLLNGKSGSGKSTICKLLYKEIDNINGNIFIGEDNIKDLSLESIREQILYVSQNEEIFTGTIKDNILIGRNINDVLFKDICKICRVDELVSKKGMSYESIIQSSASSISGGEKQRIILARGLLKNARIIILDEALSEVDYNLEKDILKSIRKYFYDKTIIYISHKNQISNFENVVEIKKTNVRLQN